MALYLVQGRGEGEGGENTICQLTGDEIMSITALRVLGRFLLLKSTKMHAFLVQSSAFTLSRICLVLVPKRLKSLHDG